MPTIPGPFSHDAPSLKQVVEPAGAVTLAALLTPEFAALRATAAEEARAGTRATPLESVAAVVCGGNVDAHAFAQHVAPQN